MDPVLFRDTPFYRSPKCGTFRGLRGDLTLMVFGFTFFLDIPELVDSVPLVFSRIPTGQYTRSSYVAILDNKGSWKFYPAEHASKEGITSQDVEEAAQAKYIETFIAFFSVVYDRQYDFQNMSQLRDVARLFGKYQSLRRPSAYLSFKFPAENPVLFKTLGEDIIENIRMAEELRSRWLYDECFTLLAGQVLQDRHPGLLSSNDVLSVSTRGQLSVACNETKKMYQSSCGRIERLLTMFEQLLDGKNDGCISAFLCKIYDFRWAMKVANPPCEGPRYCRELRTLVVILEECMVQEKVEQYAIMVPVCQEMSACKDEIDRLLMSKLQYHARPGPCDMFTCMSPQSYPWVNPGWFAYLCQSWFRIRSFGDMRWTG